MAMSWSFVTGRDFSRAARQAKTFGALAPEECLSNARGEAEVLGTKKSRKEDAGPSAPLKYVSLRMTGCLAG
jgi:hypothetical protein